MTALESIAHIGDVPLSIEAELDRRVMTVRRILELKPGTVIKLSRSAGENISLLVGGSLVGSGEIVVLEEIVGVRITDFNDDE